MPRKSTRSPFTLLLATALTASIGVLTVVGPPAAAAFSGTKLFDEAFTTNVANGKGDEVLPLIGSGQANSACLTVAGNTTQVPKSCTTGNDASNGALRLTADVAGKAGSIFDQVSVPTSKGFSATFEMHQWGTSSTPADGLAFTVAAVDPANPLAPASVGGTGGPLGYSAYRSGGVQGLDHGYLGFGFDVFGNFSNSTYEGSNCTDPPYIKVNGKVPGQAVVRGPGQGVLGYCAINSTATDTTSPALPMHGTTRANSLINVSVGVNPTATDLVDQNGLTIPAGKYLVQFTPIGGTLKTLTGSLPVVSPTFYGANTSGWITSAGIPRQLVFGWTASTGSLVDNHEITNAQVYSLSAVPQLSVTQISFVDSNPAVGAPVTYQVNTGVATGTDESRPIYVTDTMPTGVKPQSAGGNGWVCDPPSGQQISCTNSNSPFVAGSSLPVLYVQGIVTQSGLTSAGIAANTVATASSVDALAGLSTGATPAAPSQPPSGVTASPSSGARAGGNTVTLSGTNVSSATSVQIGTDAQFTAGTVSTLSPCPGNVPAAGCFTTSGATVVISSMPAHASGLVQVRVVTYGAGSSAAYTYTSVPNAPTVTAVAGVSGASVSWTAPSDTGGSAVTAYQVTPIRDGVRGTTTTVGASTLSKVYSGLDPRVSYTFEVIATNVNGNGTPGVSNAVVPYTLPNQPTNVSGTASDNAVLLTWVAPTDNGGSPVTSYVVTPYIGGTAQTAITTADAATSLTVSGLTAGTSYTFTVKAVNAAGMGPASAASAAVVPNAPPVLSFPAPPGGEVSAPYSATLTVTGGTAPFSWSIESGTLPIGLSLSSGTGVISGTPTVAGTSSAVIGVTDAAGLKSTEAISITIAAAPRINSGPPPAGEVSAPYSFQFTVAGGTGPFVWSVSSGVVPAGLTLDSVTGTLTGTPTSAGSSSFTVKALDAYSVSDRNAVVVTVAPRVALSYPSAISGQQGVAILVDPAVSGGTGPFTYQLSGGSLPAGVSVVGTTGRIRGTPTQGGVFSAQITLTDALGVTSTASTTLTIRMISTVVLTASAPRVAIGDTVQLTATVGPSSPTGSVQFTLVPSSGPDAGTTVVLGTSNVAADGTAVLAMSATSFGADVITATYSGDTLHVGAVSAPATVEVAASAGLVLVEEMRLFGPGGAGDSYVQLTNPTTVPIPLAGMTVTGVSGAVITLSAAAPTLQPAHNFLLAGPAFSLDSFASVDRRFNLDLGTGGVRVAAPDTAGTIVDAVGSTAGYSTGTPLPLVSGPSSVQQAWTRQITGGRSQNTADNRADFNFVSVTGGQISGVQSVLGSPAPAASADPARNNSGFVSSLLDSGRTAAQPPNRTSTSQVGSTPGSLVIRRKITNTTTSTIHAASLRITSISQPNGRDQPGVPQQPPRKVNLWLVDPSSPTTVVTLSDGTNVTVSNLAVTSVSDADGGGALNSTLHVPLPQGGLAPGSSVFVSLTFNYLGHGTFWFSYDAEIS